MSGRNGAHGCADCARAAHRCRRPRRLREVGTCRRLGTAGSPVVELDEEFWNEQLEPLPVPEWRGRHWVLAEGKPGFWTAISDCTTISRRGWWALTPSSSSTGRVDRDACFPGYPSSTRLRDKIGPMTVPNDGVRANRSVDAPVCCDVINRAVEEMDGLNDAARRRIRTATSLPCSTLSLRPGTRSCTSSTGGVYESVPSMVPRSSACTSTRARRTGALAMRS
jgi:hypothetical protein